MSHSKCGTRVTSSTGEAWTTRRGAQRLVDRRLGERQPDGTIRMFEGDYRYACEPVNHSGPALVVTIPEWSECWLNSEAAVLRFEGGKAA